MQEWVTIGTPRVADGSEFDLAPRGDEWVVRVEGRVLMGNRVHDSEEALAEEALTRAEGAERVLVGGLGLGYTLRAVLDMVGEDAEVTVAELVPELVEWNRAHLGHLADHPLADPRTRVAVGDVYELLKKSPRSFDAILLDVDNGPEAISQAKNQRLYAEGGVAACAAALRPGGVLAVWSAGENAKYVKRLERHGFGVEVMRVAARAGSRARHVIFVGERG